MSLYKLNIDAVDYAPGSKYKKFDAMIFKTEKDALKFIFEQDYEYIQLVDYDPIELYIYGSYMHSEEYWCTVKIEKVNNH